MTSILTAVFQGAGHLMQRHYQWIGPAAAATTTNYHKDNTYNEADGNNKQVNKHTVPKTPNATNRDSNSVMKMYNCS